MQSATHKGLQGSSGFNPQTLALRCTDSLEWQSCLTFHRPTSGREKRYETLQERQAYIIEMGGSGDLPEAEELQRPWRERPNDAHFPLLVTLRALDKEVFPFVYGTKVELVFGFKGA